jgi:hypothetical protein
MKATPETEIPEAANPSLLPSVDNPIVPCDPAGLPHADRDLEADAAAVLPAALIPLRRPTLNGRNVRTAVLWEVRTKLVVDGQVETWLYRREPAARAHAARLRGQGWPVKVARAAVTGWSVVG